MAKKKKDQDAAAEAALLAGTLPDEDRRAPEAVPEPDAVAEPVAEPPVEVAAPEPESIAPSKPDASIERASVLCGSDGLPLPE